MVKPNSIKKKKTVVVFVTGDPTGNEIGLLGGADPARLSQLIDPSEVRNLSDGLLLASMRNQFTLTIKPDKLEFEDGSDEMPVRTDFPPRAVSIGKFIAQVSRQSYVAVGLHYHIEMESEGTELPSAVLLSRIVKEDVLGDTSYNLVGASGRFWYILRDTLCELRVEPLGNQINNRGYFAYLHVHIQTGNNDTITPEWIAAALNQGYQDLLRILAELLKPRDQ